MIPVAPHIANWALQRERATSSECRVSAEVPTDTRKRKKEEPAAVEKTDERVLECGSGGGPPPAPPQPSPMEQAQAKDWENQQEFEREQKRLDAEKAIQDQKDAEALANWKTRRGNAYNTAISQGNQRLAALGLDANDPYGLGTSYRARIDANNQALADLDDFSTAFSPNIFDEISGTIRTGQRNKYKSAFNSAIAPTYAEDMFGSTADDAILASILNDQYNQASSDLMAARDRGQVSNIAYDRALRDLGNAKFTANSELQNIGQGVLTGITDEFGRRRTAALDDIADWDFGEGNYDTSGAANRLRTYAEGRRSGLEGDIRTAIGGREFFDVPGLIGKASAKVGNQTTPTGTSALYDTFQNEAQRNADTVRQNEGIY